jgi:hypothetical protein
MNDHAQPLFGADGEPCATCGAPLAADQRYCLSCGTRRAEARLPFLDVLGSSTELVPYGSPLPAGQQWPPSGGPGPAGGGAGWTINDRLRRNAPLMGLLGILLGAVLIGVLIGHWAGGPADVAAQPPQVISIGAAPAAAVAPAAATTTPADGTSTGAASGSGSGSGSTRAKGAKKGAAATKPKAANQQIDKLNSLSGKAYQKQVDKLGKKISTGGKAPPKDNKAPAGGGSFQDIG